MTSLQTEVEEVVGKAITPSHRCVPDVEMLLRCRRTVTASPGVTVAARVVNVTVIARDVEVAVRTIVLVGCRRRMAAKGTFD